MFKFGKVSIEALEKIIPLVCIDFIETKDGLIFLNQGNDSDLERNIIPDTDKTAIESLENHIHISEKLGIRTCFKLFLVAKKIGEVWAEKLKMEFPSRNFRIYLNYSDDIILRFHQVHEGESNWLNESDWSSEISKGKLIVWDV